MEYDLPLQHFARQVAGTPQAPWLHQPIDRQWHTFTWGEADNQARRIAAGLKAQGYAPGSRIAILSKNCAEWVIADLAIMMAGMISVPIYSTAGKSTIEYILDHSASNAIFVGKLDKPEAADQAIPTGVERIAFPYQTVPATALWQQWLDSHQPLQDIADPKPGDVMTIPYTSGSTGVPKGVALTFLNLAASAECSARQIDGLPGDRALSYLPMAHITERALVELVSMVLGSEVFFNESLDTFADDLRYTRPSTFISVPRLWSRFQSQILSQISDKKLQRLLRIPILGKTGSGENSPQHGPGPGTFFWLRHGADFTGDAALVPSSGDLDWRRLGNDRNGWTYPAVISRFEPRILAASVVLSIVSK